MSKSKRKAKAKVTPPKRRATKRKATARVVKPGAFTIPNVATTTAGNWSSCWYIPAPRRGKGAK